MSDPGAGWPAAPTPEESDADAGWAYAPEPPTATAEESAKGIVSPGWSESSDQSWPEPPGAAGTRPEAAEPLFATATDDTPAVESEPDLGNPASAAAERAQRLLDELQATIAAIPTANGPDLGGVISDLEVAVTHPAALQPDDLAELREALLAARERPRDLDTLLDLTGRIDAMMAVMISYDRAVAAIERSLDTLRGDRVMG